MGAGACELADLLGILLCLLAISTSCMCKSQQVEIHQACGWDSQASKHGQKGH